MKQEIQMLPVRCKGCNATFDLWPILQEQEQASKMALAENHFARLLKQSFCPDCKQAVLLGMAEQGETCLEEMQEDMEENMGEDEYEITLDLN
jgi:hypothetical protein